MGEFVTWDGRTISDAPKYVFEGHGGRLFGPFDSVHDAARYAAIYIEACLAHSGSPRPWPIAVTIRAIREAGKVNER